MNRAVLQISDKSNTRVYAALFVLIIAFIATACIEEYDPKIITETELLVIDGCIIKGDSLQFVYVSRSTSIDNSYFNAVSGCVVWATNGQGVEFTFEEKDDGEYSAVIPDAYLAYGSQFKITVIIPNGNEYESDYETIYESSAIDSLYYEIESYQSSSVSSNIGLQFYCDLKADETATLNYMWLLEETWETHSPFLIAKILDQETNEVTYFDPATDSLQVCYDTDPVSEIYTASTENLTSNEKKKIPLRYMADTNYKINYNYSILAKQYALSDAAYDYWSQLQVLSSESSGMYETQPSNVTGNICNINNPDEEVLGYFYAASYSEKRLNFKGPLTDYNSAHTCSLIAYDVDNPPGYEPVYFSTTGQIADPVCFNCTLMDGTLTKPDFFE